MGHTILLVDDERGVLSMTKDVLELVGGYTVLAAASGDEALRIEQAWPDPIDLLMTDLLMPGITGPEIARELVLRRPMKVLYMSGFTAGTLEDQGAEAISGMPMLAKPFTIEAALSKIAEVLGTSLRGASAGSDRDDEADVASTRAWPEPMRAIAVSKRERRQGGRLGMTTSPPSR